MHDRSDAGGDVATRYSTGLGLHVIPPDWVLGPDITTEEAVRRYVLDHLISMGLARHALFLLLLIIKITCTYHNYTMYSWAFD